MAHQGPRPRIVAFNTSPAISWRRSLACWAMFLLMMASAVHGSKRTAQPAPLSPWHQGTASFFGGPADSNSGNQFKMTIDSGSCGYGDFDPRLYPFYSVVGLHPSNAIVLDRPEAACGSCLEIQCTDDRSHVCYRTKPLTAIITDQCDQDCNATNINMHVFAFEMLAPIRIGRMGIRYRLVECDPADPITIHVSDYRASEGGWIRMAFKNLAGDGGLVAVELAKSTDSLQAGNSSQQKWAALTNTFGAEWELSGLPRPPLDIRLTNTINQKVIIRNAISIAGATGNIETSAQFPLAAAATGINHSTSAAVPASLSVKKPNNTLPFVSLKLPVSTTTDTAANNNGVVDIGEAIQPHTQSSDLLLPGLNVTINGNMTQTNVTGALPASPLPAAVNASNGLQGQNTTSKPIGRRMFFFKR